MDRLVLIKHNGKTLEIQCDEMTIDSVPEMNDSETELLFHRVVVNVRGRHYPTAESPRPT